MMFQNGAKEINLGSTFEYDFGQVSAINAYWSLGGWYRLDDAIILTTGIGFKNMHLGISYDINNSPLKIATNKKGAFEVTLRYFYKSDLVKFNFHDIRI